MLSADTSALDPQGFLFEKEREQQQQQQPGRNSSGAQRKLTVDAKRQVASCPAPQSLPSSLLHTRFVAATSSIGAVD